MMNTLVTEMIIVFVMTVISVFIDVAVLMHTDKRHKGTRIFFIAALIFSIGSMLLFESIWMSMLLTQ